MLLGEESFDLPTNRTTPSKFPAQPRPIGAVRRATYAIEIEGVWQRLGDAAAQRASRSHLLSALEFCARFRQLIGGKIRIFWGNQA
ncbi:UNVERIFIED_ORG: hypothetical protein GGI63_000874 [Rhizobium esperanzae]|uniref:hypothetical protein n=1 Tax=Rhizobium phaseoli TaxID=396 RepID=UPI00056AF597|nr:hypothetical protein [Rhizobium phaseoli]MDK4725641.1 hypothetical protein [Rhizobium phaseoli]NKE89151.1 hypothetical protein [Rhizobium phaseoli]